MRQRKRASQESAAARSGADARLVRAIGDYCHIVPGAFTPVLAKHTKHLGLVDVLSIGVDRIQRNFEPMKKQVEGWKATRIPDEAAKLAIYRAFVEGELDGSSLDLLPIPRRKPERHHKGTP